MSYYDKADEIPEYIDLLEEAQHKLAWANLPMSDDQLLAMPPPLFWPPAISHAPPTNVRCSPGSAKHGPLGRLATVLHTSHANANSLLRAPPRWVLPTPPLRETPSHLTHSPAWMATSTTSLRPPPLNAQCSINSWRPTRHSPPRLHTLRRVSQPSLRLTPCLLTNHRQPCRNLRPVPLPLSQKSDLILMATVGHMATVSNLATPVLPAPTKLRAIRFQQHAPTPWGGVPKTNLLDNRGRIG